MKSLRLDTKIIGMVLILLILMIISSGFGLIKIRSIGNEIKGLSEEDIPLTGLVTEITVNQLEQAIWLERALRFGEVLASKEAAQKGLMQAEEEFEKHTLLADEEFKEAEELAEHTAQNAGTAKSRAEFQEIEQQLKVIETHHSAYEQHVHQVFALINEGKTTDAEALAEEIEAEEEELDYELEAFLEKINTFTQEASLKAENDQKSAIQGMSILSVLSVIIGFSLGIFITRSITGPVNRVIKGLNEGSEQVASASSQVSGASQSLAEGASEQAASIEETSSALEEMSAMTRQNANHAENADNLMKEANQVVSYANDSMTALTTSMDEISRASEETSKIVKTIDEIAFQTNLLALNAAVEAARAGEAGAGFAVVADEVRNLAMRAADASKNTADLIEDTVMRVKDGAEIVSKTNKAFIEVSDSTSKVGEIVGEIAAASSEQAQGIEQINKAITEMDQVVQQNAASTEESASASEEMNAQAVQMRHFVSDLLVIVGGNGESKKASESQTDKTQHRTSPKAKRTVTVPQVPKRTIVPPERLIPMEESDFSDF